MAARRARRRVVGPRQRREIVRRTRGAGQVGRVGRQSTSRQQHHVRHAGQPGQQFVHHRPAVVHDAAVDLAVDDDQHLGRDLAEAVEHGHRAHVGGAHRPHRAQAGQARKATMVGGVLGRKAHTRSPGTTPMPLSAAARRRPGGAARASHLTRARPCARSGTPAPGGRPPAPPRHGEKLLRVVDLRAGEPPAPGITASTSTVSVGVGDCRPNSPRPSAQKPAGRRLTSATARRSCRRPGRAARAASGGTV